MSISTVGIFLMKSEDDGTNWNKLIDIKNFPNLGGARETIETTTLSDTSKKYILGLESTDALEFTANYTKTDYVALKAVEGEDASYSVWLGYTGSGSTIAPSGDDGKFTFTGQLSVYPTSGESNGVVEMSITIAPTSAIELED